jgi:hypothetical protein
MMMSFSRMISTAARCSLVCCSSSSSSSSSKVLRLNGTHQRPCSAA